MSGGKIIHINPDLFQVQKKTKKNRTGGTNVSIPKPVIASSVIKRKLLNRVKEKKNEENKINKNINKSKSYDPDFYGDLENDDVENEDIENENEDIDELSSAMNYFDSISEREKERKKMLNRTYRNRENDARNKNHQLNNLQLNIPHQLKQSQMNEVVETDNINSIASIILDDLPYGCLKNGMKPTYKNWMNNIKNYSSMSNTNIIKPPTPPKKKQKNEENIFTDIEYKKSLFEESDKHKENILKKQISDKLKKIENEQNSHPYDDIDNASGGNVSNKQYVKRIIKKKYNLGKSSKYRKVSVLIKGRQTKKNIINSHKKLKHIDIHQIKKYLKKHGMLKTGSSCPDEILRKMYESAMLSGEINNTNKNTLIHNFLNDDENLK